MQNKKKIPNHEEVKTIFKESYLLFEKHKVADSEEDFKRLTDEARLIYNKYDFDLCHEMIVGILSVIEEYWKERQEVAK